MHFYFGKEFAAVATGTIVREVHCEQCGCEFFYRLVRRGEGHAHSPYYLNNRGAERRAQRRADQRLARMLTRDVDPVACPDCGWFQQSMVRELRRRQARWMLFLALILGCFFGLVIVIWIPTATTGFERRMNESDTAVLLVMLGLFMIFGCGPLLLRALLLRLIRPNRRYPQLPPPMPGAPRAFKADQDPADEQDDVQPLQTGGWATIQLLDLSTPHECCSCFEPTPWVRHFKPNRLVDIGVAVCPRCWKSYRWSQWYWTLGASLIAGVGVYALLRNQRLPIEQQVAFALMASLIMLLIALLIATKIFSPVRFSGFDRKLNTICVRFRNPQYMPHFLAHYRHPRPAR